MTEREIELLSSLFYQVYNIILGDVNLYDEYV